jgi:hypothetical protein
MSHTPEQRTAIRGAIEGLSIKDVATAGRALLDALGYRSPKTLDAPSEPSQFLGALEMDSGKFEGLDRWRSVHFLFQLTGDELPALSRGGEPATGEAFQRGAIDSFVFVALDLDDEPWSRRQLVAIVRAFNRGFAMPAILLFRHAGSATLAVIDRRANRRDPSRDVVGGRISLVKDIDLANPHRAHVEILADLSLSALAARKTPSDFRTLYDLWLDTLSAAELNKRFYEELADWFAWASTRAAVSFSKGQGTGEGAKEIALIRLLTRLMFVWFIKEKRLVPEALFDASALAKLLKEPPASTPKGHGYYLAVLQNLFFATLNTEMNEPGGPINRRWRHDEGGQSKDYLGHHVFRHATLFAEPAKALKAFESVPFLNGGLFECLDCEVGADDPRKDLAEHERGRLILRIDGFSDQPDKQPRLPNALFFGLHKNVDLSDYFGKRRVVDVAGLVDLFERYKFTVEENTPLEEEAALDPELLGKVFENLLASYNEDTKTTARNKSGSFYTPREVVDFMVDEALVAWLLPKLPGELDLKRPRSQGLDFGAMPGELDVSSPSPHPSSKVGADDEAGLRALLSFASRSHDFTPAQVDALIAAIESCKAIDPAVGSGAFPLGLLQKLVHVLDVLDPGGEKWRARNRLYYERRLAEAENIPAASERAAEIDKARAALADFDAKFEGGHYPDYTRKLFLIDRCLHGVDIQPIAVQIAKLRCFISLAVEQKENPERPNRGITPLPNLEAKFVAANTLTPLHRERQLQLVDPRVDETRSELDRQFHALFAAPNAAAKRKVQTRINELLEALATLMRDSRVITSDEAALVSRWRPFDANAFAPFFDAALMFGIKPGVDEGWFDIAFANPPYIRQEKIESFRVNDRPVIAKAQLKADYKTYSGTADIYVYFYERALRLLKPAGALAFITSNKWYRAAYGKGLRELLSTHARILKIIDFGDAPVFEAIAYPTILVGTRKSAPGKPAPSETIQSLNWSTLAGEDPQEAVKHFPDRFAAEAFAMPQVDLSPAGWQLEPKAERDLLARLRAGGTPLGEWCKGRFYRGVLTGLNAAFVIDGAKRLELIAADPNSAEIIRPFLRGRDVKRWKVEPADKWLIFVPWHFPLQDDDTISGSSATAEAAFKRGYPAVYQHLVSWKSELSSRNKAETGISYEWYALQRWASGYWREFSEPKIFVPAIEQRCAYAVDRDGFFGNDKTSIIVSDKAEFLCGILNSAYSWWITKQEFSSKQGGFYEFKPMYVGALPVPHATDEQEAAVTLVSRALIAGADRPRLEALVNAFVYELFFAEELHARNLHPFAAARDAGLMKLTDLEGPTLARVADDWSRCLADPAHPLYATLFDLQSIDSVRIIEGRG